MLRLNILITNPPPPLWIKWLRIPFTIYCFSECVCIHVTGTLVTDSCITLVYCISLILFWPTHFPHSAIIDSYMSKTQSVLMLSVHISKEQINNLYNKDSVLYNVYVSCITQRVHGCVVTIWSLVRGWRFARWSSLMCVCILGTFFTRQCATFSRSLILRSMMSKYNITLYAVTCALSPVVEVEHLMWVSNFVSSQMFWKCETYNQEHT